MSIFHWTLGKESSEFDREMDAGLLIKFQALELMMVDFSLVEVQRNKRTKVKLGYNDWSEELRLKTNLRLVSLKGQ